ncbi:hypothetical protein D1816_18210 [Aquimarina sp. AD10]|uniref:Rieske domain-containing protein n=1 Tax=Aquimarina aggregata TaxID=1642818 RepID=A0A162ZLV9_9FLAO|nr:MULTISPECIES: hypothetical protein [Aquimarina]AXT62211.1 hypothetical protein D1816_18210 [Aquimarina sp. AD10]KZS39895.1 hypothetical protein AWE51_09630 [Aquimarina aggregata]RKM90594.1 hypothetical protein D7033_24170 [Aquimarina sp. AD10]
MKKLVFLFAALLVLSCSGDDDQNNPFLPNIAVNFQINLDLPQYNNLRFPGGIFVDRTDGRGIRGVIIYNQNDQQFFAYELSDPNISPSDCSALKVEGTRASSNCGNENLYEIASFGQQIRGEGGNPLLAYRVTKNGNTLNVSN